MLPLDIAKAAIRAGFAPNPSGLLGDADRAVALALAESTGNPNATHVNSDGTTDYGLWQINSSHKFPELADGSWKKPEVNARLAFQVHQSQGWGAWTTYNGAKYLAALPVARVAVSEATIALGPGAAVSAAGGAATAAVGAVQDKFGDALTLLKAATKPVFWQRVIKVGLGVGLLLVCVRLAVGGKIDAAVGDTVGKVMGVVGPGGKVKAVANAAGKLKGGAS